MKKIWDFETEESIHFQKMSYLCTELLSFEKLNSALYTLHSKKRGCLVSTAGRKGK